VVLAMESYPGSYPHGEPISGLDAVQSGKVFHAGTGLSPEGIVETQGGRVLCVVGKGAAFEDARAEAYGAIEKIAFNSMAYRRDIGHRMGA
jgi:phosphoribosylamine--glycine ligase